MVVNKVQSEAESGSQQGKWKMQVKHRNSWISNLISNAPILIQCHIGLPLVRTGCFGVRTTNMFQALCYMLEKTVKDKMHSPSSKEGITFISVTWVLSRSKTSDTWASLQTCWIRILWAEGAGWGEVGSRDLLLKKASQVNLPNVWGKAGMRSWMAPD